MSAQDVLIIAGLALVAVGIIGAVAEHITNRRERRQEAWFRYLAQTEAMERRRAARRDDG